jgi:hypothetical protein
MATKRMVSGGVRWAVSVLVALLLVGGALAAGYYAYQSGYARGVLENATFVVPEAAPEGAVPFFYYGRPFMHPGFGWGPGGMVGPFIGGFIQCLIPLFFLFLFFGLLRMLFWRGRWGHGWGGPGHWPGGLPPHFEEWHRRAHGEAPGTDSNPPG